MHLGDIGFILAFIVLPILIVIFCISAVRTVRRRAVPPPPPLDEPPFEPRDWAASVRPIRGQATQVTSTKTRVQTETRTFRTPEYRGKAQGTVRRLNAAALRRGRRNDPDAF